MTPIVFAVFSLLAVSGVLSQTKLPNIIKDPCSGLVCLNGGTCTARAHAPYCQCPTGFLGSKCEFSIRPGTCPVIKKGDVSVCGGVNCTSDKHCPYNQKCCTLACGGTFCTKVDIIRDPCRGFVCLNGGTCTAPGDAPSCQCPTGFSGPKCEFSNRPGTCPVIKKGDVSVCGGVRCTSDQQCPYNQKCCTLACGGTFCTNVEHPPTLTCANGLCNVSSVCRNVCTCSSCPVGPTCIPVGQVYDGIDNDCRRQNYTQVVLVENPSNSSKYNQLTCAPRNQTCPSGSDCAGGLCCQGKVTIPLIKSGFCPNVSVCNGTACTNDYECPGEQKCCPGCRNVCRNPITRCPPGLVCVLRTPYCPPGRFCIQIVLPVRVRSQCVNCTSNEVCVPRGSGYVCTKPNQCGGCPLGQVCRPTNIVCVTTSCPQYACVPIDRCGGCPGGQVCRLNSCITHTCASYQCYPDVP